MSASSVELTDPSTTPATHRALIRQSLLYSVLVLSGFAGLGYQVAWMRMLAVSLGHEFIAVLAVLGAFFVGLAVGGLVLNNWIKTTNNPVRGYAVLELVIGLWALILIGILPLTTEVASQWMGTSPGPMQHWGVAFGTTFFLLLPATAAMGATLPAAERLGRLLFTNKVIVPGFYAANTIGAMLGTLIATFLLLPNLGLRETLLLFAGANFLVAAVVLIMRWPSSPLTSNTLSLSQSTTKPSISKATRLLTLLFFTGLLGLGYEVLIVRVLSQVLEGTVYSFAAVLAVYLLGTSLGAAAYQRWWYAPGSLSTWRTQAAFYLGASAFFCTLGIVLLWQTETVYHTLFAALGPGNITGLIAELSVAALTFLLPTCAMGALFSHLASRTGPTVGFGVVFGVNTLGAAFAPLLFGVLALPALGAKIALLIIVLGYGLGALWLSSGTLKWRLTALITAGAFALLWGNQPLRFVPLGPDDTVLAYEEGVVAAVAVIEEPDKSRHLTVNNNFTMGGTASRFSDHRQTHVPLLMHSKPRDVLYLGLGTGITFQAAQYHPGLRATGVELIPEMLPLMPLFGVETAGDHWREKPRVITADARRFVTTDTQYYDAIIAEVFHPSRDGAGSLYTTEHFQAIRERLAPGGLFCQWLPLFQLDLKTLQTIVRSYLAVFPEVQLHLAHLSLGQPLLCLLGSEQAIAFDSDWLANRVEDRRLQQQLVSLRLNSDFALFGGFLGGKVALKEFAGEGALNTDNLPLVTYKAPAFVYTEPNSPAERLMELVNRMAPKRGTLLDEANADANFEARLQKYWQARDAFLAAGIGVRPSANVQTMLEQTQTRLLSIVRISGDFLPAYQPLMAMARQLHPQDPTAAERLLHELDRANPGLPWARQLLRQLQEP